ncbi:hypothetical protein K438DRAFT_2027350 [Mycena galopus ATCC 62051]|nr:hypothetical protein K438DRAFT_2027350 [Mycena galopus ATCC 62051]
MAVDEFTDIFMPIAIGSEPYPMDEFTDIFTPDVMVSEPPTDTPVDGDTPVGYGISRSFLFHALTQLAHSPSPFVSLAFSLGFHCISDIDPIMRIIIRIVVSLRLSISISVSRTVRLPILNDFR